MPEHQESISEDIFSLKQKIRVLERKLEEIRSQTHILLDIARALNASLDKQVIAKNIVNAVASLIDVTQVNVCLYSEKNQGFEVIGVHNASSSAGPPTLDLNFLNQVLMGGMPRYHAFQGTPGRKWKCYLPLQNAQRKIGLIIIETLPDLEITEEQTGFLETVASHASSALENALLYAIVEKESITDGLTGAYNHRYFQKRLHEHISLFHRHKNILSFGIILLDVDHFKLFNDRYGHQVGDLVLQIIVKELHSNLRQEDLLARYGGEEFVVLIPQVTESIVQLVSEKIREIIEHTAINHSPTGESASVTVSIGATLYRPSDTSVSLISRVDQALYQAKMNGRNQCIFV